MAVAGSQPATSLQRNPRYLTQIDLSGVEATTIAEAPVASPELVVIALPSSTMNMTGFSSWSRGSSFGNEFRTAPATISREKMLADLCAI